MYSYAINNQSMTITTTDCVEDLGMYIAIKLYPRL